MLSEIRQTLKEKYYMFSYVEHGFKVACMYIYRRVYMLQQSWNWKKDHESEEEGFKEVGWGKKW